MGQWRLTVREDRGRAVVTVLCADEPVGVVNVSVKDYDVLCKKIMSSLTSTMQNVIFDTLNRELWARAQRASNEDEETAKRRLREIGMGSGVVNELTNGIVMLIAGELLKQMPEHVT